jgi:hypothetical protein
VREIDCGKLAPRVRRAHIDDPKHFDALPRRLGPEQAKGLAALDTAPEIPLDG